MLAALSSCTTVSSPTETLAVSSQDAALHRGRDGYPDFSAPLRAAMAQMTDEEARQMGDELAALSAGRKAGTVSEAQYWKRVKELETLARQHSADTIAEIEAGQQP